MTPDRFRAAFATVERIIEERWGIPVVIGDVPNPFTGDLDGAEIRIDYDLEAEDAMFIVIHLFGHTVQWNTAASARAIATYPGPWDAEHLALLRDYETTACRYSLALLHDAGIHDLDQWLSDFAACDYAYLERFYQTGEKVPFRSLWKANAPLLTPLPVPAFTPEKWWSRWQGVVI